MELFIITGTSRGLGWALVEQCLQKGCTVAAISRSEMPLKNPKLCHFAQDLTVTDELAPLMANIFGQLRPEKFDKIHLIHNAGLIEPIGLAQENTENEILANLATNLTAPILLSKEFLRGTRSYQGWRTLTGIVTGWPKPYWSLYSATKAGLRAYVQSLAKEFEGQDKIRLLNFDPGGMDTDMQLQIRNSPSEKFPLVDNFKKLAQDGKLRPPAHVATALLAHLKEPQKMNAVDVSVKDLIPHNS